jgi:hypothetical protein
MMVFRAVMASAGGTSKFVTYKDVAEQIEKMRIREEGYTKAYVYRQLSALEEDGYLVVDAIHRPKKYAISEAGIVAGLKKKRDEKLVESKSKKEEISKRRVLLTTINPEELALSVYNDLAGLTSIKSSTIIEGIENVRNMVIREFGSSAKPGDVIRVVAPASLLDGGLTGPGMAELSLMKRAADDVKILGLMIPKGDISFSTELIASFTKNIGTAFTSFAASGNICLKIAKENVKTYRMVSLNREKMLLYLTHAPDSDIAALIHRKDNPGLIDDAVDTFDRLTNEGIDVIEIVKQMIASDTET